MGRCIPPPPRAMGCNRNRPDINTTTVGGRGGTGGLCIAVVIAPSRRARGGGGWEMDICDPPVGASQFSPTQVLEDADDKVAVLHRTVLMLQSAQLPLMKEH